METSHGLALIIQNLQRYLENKNTLAGLYLTKTEQQMQDH